MKYKSVSFIENSRNRFSETENIPQLAINLDVVLEALQDARDRLQRLDEPRNEA